MVSRERLKQGWTIHRWLLLTVVFVGAALYFGLQYVSRLTIMRAKQTATATIPVIVAAGSIPAYEPLTSQEVRVELMPSDAVPPGALTAVGQIQGAWTVHAVSQGVPVVQADVFWPHNANVLAARISPQDMAIDLPLTAQDAVDGLIQPGDHISLFTTITSAQGPQTVDFLNNIPVLAVNGSLAPLSTAPVGQGEVLVLALPPKDVAALIFAQQQAPFVVALDSPHSKAAPPLPYDMTQYKTGKP